MYSGPKFVWPMRRRIDKWGQSKNTVVFETCSTRPTKKLLYFYSDPIYASYVDIAFATSFGEAPSASRDFMIKSMETLGSPASIFATRD